MGKLIRVVTITWLLLCQAIPAVWAASPDPIEFGLTVERGDKRTVTRWLDEGMPADFVADRIGTGLMIAAWNGNIEMMELFVSRGANPRRANNNGEQAVQLAAWNGHTAAVRWLLERGGVLNRDDKHWNALHYAVFNGHTELAGELIQRGADVNARTPNGATPLMLAAREGRDDAAKLLLESGADTTAKSDWGDTALIFAMRYDHYRLGKMISTPEEFDIAVKAPKESFGEASRSAAAPAKVEDILRQIREANATGAQTTELRKQLHTAIAEFRGPVKPQGMMKGRMIKPTPPPRGLMITAKRAQPASGERVEIVPGRRRSAAGRCAGNARAAGQQPQSHRRSGAPDPRCRDAGTTDRSASSATRRGHGQAEIGNRSDEFFRQFVRQERIQRRRCPPEISGRQGYGRYRPAPQGHQRCAPAPGTGRRAGVGVRQYGRRPHAAQHRTDAGEVVIQPLAESLLHPPGNHHRHPCPQPGHSQLSSVERGAGD
ncbi:MAG: ankyrin repeat domain-containing protein [Betaproteobacteria bacterium]|nr:ankyrin repeat domain-containing protein [Betaproteobacteria bacterium]